MTKEEAIENIKLIRFNAAITSANSFKEALDMAIGALSKPSLPSNLDEAAEESAERWRKNPDGSESRELFFQPHIRGFKAGVEWMAGQGYTQEGVAHPDDCEIWVNMKNTDIKDGDKVVVQIRKK